VPQYILNQHVMEKRNVNILVTQPRKLAARSLATRICEERDWQLGRLVSYQVDLDSKISNNTRLLVCTTTILKDRMIREKNLGQWTHVIIDDVHERDVDMELMLTLCKKFCFTNSRNTKLILMSAIPDEHKLRDYFSNPGFMPAAYLDVGQKRGLKNFALFNYDTLINSYRLQFLPRPNFQVTKPALHQTCVELAKTIIIKIDELEVAVRVKPGAVLVFLPGINEIQEVRAVLMDNTAEDKSGRRPEWKIYSLHDSISWQEQQQMLEEAPPKTRKIILASVESSLTIPDIEYVIDFGLTEKKQVDNTNSSRLVLDWACRNQLVQRSGWAGRVNRNGRVFVLVPEWMAQNLPQEHASEMRRVPLTEIVLDIEMLDLGSPKEILALAMDPPTIELLLRSIVSVQEMKKLKTRDDD